MLSEADLNRIKGLLHFLNASHKPTTRNEKEPRRLQVAAPEDRERGEGSTLQFHINIRNEQGVLVGQIYKLDDKYVFGVMA